MKLNRKRKAYIGLGFIIFILIITNPTLKDFKEYRGNSSYEGLYRTGNYFIFSTYSEYSDYIGLLGNFWRRRSDVIPISKDTTWTPPITDSVVDYLPPPPPKK